MEGWPGLPEAARALVRLVSADHWADQRQRRPVPNERRVLLARVVAPAQREQVVLPVEHDGLPPTVLEALLSHHQVADLNFGPGRWISGDG